MRTPGKLLKICKNNKNTLCLMEKALVEQQLRKKFQKLLTRDVVQKTSQRILLQNSFGKSKDEFNISMVVRPSKKVLIKVPFMNTVLFILK